MLSGRTPLLAAVLVAAAYYSPPVHKSLASTYQTTVDLFDDRPVETVLIIGNSRVYCNDMPDMIRPIADSAGAPVRYVVTSHALPAARLEDHWRNADVHALLAKHWDHVIIQAQSAEQWNDDTSRKFHKYASLLINETILGGESPVAFNIGWVYGEAFWGDTLKWRSVLYKRMQADHRSLAKESHIALINTGLVWEQLHDRYPQLPLYTADGNHPAPSGSYLSALMIYSYLSGGKVDGVSFFPEGVTPEDAAKILPAVNDFNVETS